MNINLCYYCNSNEIQFFAKTYKDTNRGDCFMMCLKCELRGPEVYFFTTHKKAGVKRAIRAWNAYCKKNK